MKRFMYRCRSSIVFLMRILLYVVLLFVMLGFMSINNSQILAISRTAAVMVVTFFFASIAASVVYGKYDVGTRKSKPIILSLVLSVIIADILTFVMMVIMNTNETTENKLYPYLGKDILLMLAVIAAQVVVIVLFTYGGNAVYFRIVRPDRCLVIVKKDGEVPAFVKGVGRYKKQYSILDTVAYDDERVFDAIDAAETVFIDDLPIEARDRIAIYCYGLKKNVYRSMDIYGVMTKYSHIIFMNDVPMLVSRANRITMGQRIIKRLGDIGMSIFGLLLFSPALAVSALAIKIEDGGHVIFKQNRVTLDGRIFNIYKLRTMKENVEQSMTVTGDDRITKVGKILRKFRIDEVPQFINVLKGEMSVVGPRAEMLEHVYLYSEKLPEFVYRYRMKAGITGYAQIRGKYNTSPNDKLMMDLTYIESFSIWYDIKLLLQTVMVLLTADNSTEGFSEDTEKEHREQASQIQGKVCKKDEE